MLLFQFIPIAIMLLACFLMGNSQQSNSAVDFICSQPSVILPMREIEFHPAPVFTSTTVLVEMIAPSECNLDIIALDGFGRLSAVLYVANSTLQTQAGTFSLYEAMSIFQIDPGNSSLFTEYDKDAKEIRLSSYLLRIIFRPSAVGHHRATLQVRGRWNSSVAAITYPIRAVATISPYLWSRDYAAMAAPIELEIGQQQLQSVMNREIPLALNEAATFLLPDGIDKREETVKLMDLKVESASASFNLPPEACFPHSSTVSTATAIAGVQNNSVVNNDNKVSKFSNEINDEVDIKPKEECVLTYKLRNDLPEGVHFDVPLYLIFVSLIYFVYCCLF